MGCQSYASPLHNKITKLKTIKYAVPEGDSPMPEISDIAIFNNSILLATHSWAVVFQSHALQKLCKDKEENHITFAGAQQMSVGWVDGWKDRWMNEWMKSLFSMFSQSNRDPSMENVGMNWEPVLNQRSDWLLLLDWVKEHWVWIWKSEYNFQL